MITANFNSYNNFITDSLYQWDINQKLTIAGLNIAVAPEVHFSNANLERAIVRQSTLKDRIVTVDIPNSLLQSASRIYAHIGIYESETFKVIEAVEIPVIARKKPLDYVLENSDDEVYSFKALEYLMSNALTKTEGATIDARIDNIVANANSTDGNSELIDMRVDVDGTTHASAGTAIREQFSKTFRNQSATVNDADQCFNTGFYFVSSSGGWLNIPYADGGLLEVIAGTGDTRLYQKFYTYADSEMWIRNLRRGTFSEWVRVDTDLTLNNILNETEARYFRGEYYIENSTGTIYIYKKGHNGYIRYSYKNSIDNTINLNTWSLNDIKLCDNNMEVIKTISSNGVDNEGVLRIKGESDFIGGVHGDEQYTDFIIFVDGKEYTINTLGNMWCSEIRFIVNSNIYHCDTDTVCMTKNKQTTFDRNGVHVNNRWTLLEDIYINRVRAILLSVNKECVSKYYDSTVFTTPTNIPASNGTRNDVNMIDTYYMGDISAHIWCGVRGGDTSMYSASVEDFGNRLKSYFDCYIDYSAKTGEQLYCQNNFYITC